MNKRFLLLTIALMACGSEVDEEKTVADEAPPAVDVPNDSGTDASTDSDSQADAGLPDAAVESVPDAGSRDSSTDAASDCADPVIFDDASTSTDEGYDSGTN